MFLLTGQVVSNASCTARTPKSSLSCSLHCWPLGVPDQLVTDLVTSAPLELLHLLAAEDRLVERTKCPPLGSLWARAASLLSSGNTAGYSPSPRPERAASESLTYQSKGKRARGRLWRVTRWRGQNAIVRRAAPMKRPRAEKRAA